MPEPRQRRAETPPPVALAAQDQLIITAAEQNRGETGKLPPARLAKGAAVITGQRFGIDSSGNDASIFQLYLLCPVQQKLREDKRRLTFRENTEDMAEIVGLQEEFHFMQTPFGLQITGRADDDEIIGSEKSVLNALGEITGDGKLLLVPENPVDPGKPAALPQTLRDTERLQTVLDLDGDRGIAGRASIRYKRVIMRLTHNRSPFLKRTSGGMPSAGV